jgi:hypothetical protein
MAQNIRSSYNGYTNYMTWLLMQEIFLDIDDWGDEVITAETCREIAENVIFDNQQITGVAHTIVSQSLNETNWYEISELLEEDRAGII